MMVVVAHYAQREPTHFGIAMFKIGGLSFFFFSFSFFLKDNLVLQMSLDTVLTQYAYTTTPPSPRRR